MSETPNELSPSLGGGPAEWPHKRTPDHKFTPDWAERDYARSINVVDRLMRQRDEAYEGMRFWLAQAEEDHRLATQGHFDPSQASSGRAIEARMRRPFPDLSRASWMSR